MESEGLRVLQLIDSLTIGGAERMSVNLANALDTSGIKSYICATRSGGDLLQFINSNVGILLLNKSHSVDFKAIYKLIKFIKDNNINIIHAHSSSFFVAVICKLFVNVKVIWHDHYGKSESLEQRSSVILKAFSFKFDFVIAVNGLLVQWGKANLKIADQKIVFLKNFAKLSLKDKSSILPGNKGHRIVCLANYREQKDHLILLNAFNRIISEVDEFSNWHLLLVGVDNNDEYSSTLKNFIKNKELCENVHLLGGRDDSANILMDSTIGVLSSRSEGLPVALLEYGLAKLPVLCTDVGQCSEVLGNGEFGFVVESGSIKVFQNHLQLLMEDKLQRNTFSENFYNHVSCNYSQESMVKKIKNIYFKVLNE